MPGPKRPKRIIVWICPRASLGLSHVYSLGMLGPKRPKRIIVWICPRASLGLSHVYSLGILVGVSFQALSLLPKRYWLCSKAPSILARVVTFDLLQIFCMNRLRVEVQESSHSDGHEYSSRRFLLPRDAARCSDPKCREGNARVAFNAPS
jgi:hypothetical protein